MSTTAISQRSGPSNGSPASRLLWRFRWLILWGICLTVFVALVGFPGSRLQIFVVVGLGLIASGAASDSGTRWKRVLVDWLPFYVLLTLYDMLRGSAGSWLSPHALPQIRIDQWLFGGTAPTVSLQHALYTPGVAHVWDYAAFGVYMTHFVVPFAVAGLLWKYAHNRFRRFLVLFVLLTFAALLTYALYPAVPPWMASQNGYLPPTAKIIDEMWTHVRFGNGSGLFSGTGHFADPIAAVPSLHAAYPMLLTLFFWKRAGNWRWALAAVSPRDGVHPRVHGRALRDRHPARMGVRGDRLRRGEPALRSIRTTQDRSGACRHRAGGVTGS